MHSKEIHSGSPIKAVLWDIDGTLIDSEPLHYRVIARWCHENGYDLTEKDNKELLGKSMREKFHILSKQYDFTADFSTFSRQCAEKYSHAVSWDMRRKEPLETFKRVGVAGKKQACVSNGDRLVVLANLRTLEIEEKLSFFISGEMVDRGKPDPEPYLLAMKRLGLKAGECLAVEDSQVGFTSAKEAGLVTVVWPIELSSATSYDEADFFINSMNEFPWYLLR